MGSQVYSVRPFVSAAATLALILAAPVVARAQTCTGVPPAMVCTATTSAEFASAVSIVTASGGTVALGNNITLSGPVTIDTVPGGVTLNGNGFTLSGGGASQGLVITNSLGGPAMTIQNLTIANMTAVGGAGGNGNAGAAGGGGGAAIGGALSIGTGATVNVSNVNIVSNTAVGGAGGNGSATSGFGTGGNGGTFNNTGAPGGAGGIGGSIPNGGNSNGYGRGAGGAASPTAPGGAGNFNITVGPASAGGAGGSTDATVATSLFGGGSGGTAPSGIGAGGGGGGAALGAGVFVQAGGHLNVAGAFTVNGNSVAGGAGGAGGGGGTNGSAGSAFGSGIFFEGVSPTLAVDAGAATVTINDTLADEQGSGGLSGNSLSLSKNGSGLLVLGGNNTYTGTTTLSGGGISIASDAGLGNGGDLNMSDGTTLFVTSSGTYTHAVRLGNSTGSTLSVGSGTTVTWNGTLFNGDAGSTSLFVTGGGTLVLGSSGNSYQAGTVVTGNSTVSVSSDLNLGVTGASITLGNGSSTGTLAITTSGLFSSARPISLGAAGGIIDTSSPTNAVLSGAIGGAGGLTKNGAGSLTLSGANTYAGPTTVNAGTLFAGRANVFGAAPALNVAAFGTIDFNGFSQSINTLSGTGTVSLNGGATMTIGGTNASSSFGGSIGGTGGIVKNGSGTLTLSGTNTFIGGIAVNAGTLSVGADSNLGGNGAVSLFSNATLALTGSSTFAHTLALSGTPFVTVGSGTAATWSGAINGSGALQFAGGGTLSLTNASNTYTGGTTVTGGSTLRITADGALGAAGSTVSLGDATSTATLGIDGTVLSSRPITIGSLGATIDTSGNSATLSGPISGAGGLTKTGGGTLTLGGNNTYSGTTTAAAGTLRLGSSNAIGRGGLSIAGGATVDLNGFNLSLASITGNGTLALGGGGKVTFGAGNLTFGGTLNGSGGVIKDGGGTLTLTGANSYTGGTTVNGGTLLGNATSLQGDIVNNAAVVFDQAGTGTYAGRMSGTGSLEKANAGTLTLTGANTYTGGTLISGGTLIGNSTSLQGTIFNNSTLIFDENDTGTFTGTILGSGSMTKNGSGTLFINGANPFAGTLFVNGGTLQLNGSFAGNVNIGSAANLKGAGFVGGSITVGGLLSVPAPGTPLASFNAQRLTTNAAAIQVPSLLIGGNLTMTPGSVLDFAVTPNGAPPVVVLGSANLNGTRLNITVNDQPTARETSYLGMTTGGGLTTNALIVTSPVAGVDPVVKSNAAEMVVTLLNKNIPLAPVATTFNGGAVGNAIDRIKNNGNPDLNLVVRELTALDDQSLSNALLNLAGELHASELRASMDETTSVTDLVRDVISDRDHDGDDQPRQTGRPSVKMWFQLSGDHATYSDKGVITGVANTGGGGGGLDFHPAPRFTLGAGGSFSRVGLSLSSFGGNSDMQAPRAFGYGGMKWGPFNFHAGGSGARTVYTTRRPIQFKATVPAPDGEQALSSGIDRVAQADQIAIIRDAWTELQDTFKHKDWVYDWKIGWRRSTQDRDPFSETGAGSISLDGLAQALTMKEANVNIHVFKKRGTWRPNILVNYRREYSDDQTSAEVQFAGDPNGQFNVNGLPIPVSEFHGIFGVTMRTGSGLEYTLEYETRHSKDESHNGVHFRVRFR